MAIAEFRVSPYSVSINELAASADKKGIVLGYLHDEQALKKSPSLKDIIWDVRNLRSSDFLEILKRRKLEKEMAPTMPPSTELTLVRFPGEEYTQVSQNPVIFKFPNLNPGVPPMRSALDLLARATNPIADSPDARIALGLIGDPDAVEDQNVNDFIDRTHEEIRVCERRFGIAERNGDSEEMRKMDDVRELLAIRYLEIRGSKAKTVFPITCDLIGIRGNGKTSLKIKITVAPDKWKTLPLTSQMVDLVLKGGGWDGIRGMSPREAEILLDQLG